MSFHYVNSEVGSQSLHLLGSVFSKYRRNLLNTATLNTVIYHHVDDPRPAVGVEVPGHEVGQLSLAGMT